MQFKKLNLRKENLKYYALAIYLFHFFATQIMLPLLETHSMYPFYNWDLFSYMPRYFYNWYFIKIHEIDGEKLDRPLVYSFNRSLLKPKTNWLLHDQIFILGSAIEANSEHLTHAHKQLEANLFKRVNSAEYEVIKGNIDIREVRKTENIDESESLGRFRYQKIPSK